MKEGQKNIETILKDKFESFELQPSQKVWTGIKSGISYSPVNPIFSFFTNTHFLPIIGAIVVVVGLFTIPLLMTQDTIQIKEPTYQDTVETDDNLYAESEKKMEVMEPIDHEGSEKDKAYEKDKTSEELEVLPESEVAEIVSDQQNKISTQISGKSPEENAPDVLNITEKNVNLPVKEQAIDHGSASKTPENQTSDIFIQPMPGIYPRSVDHFIWNFRPEIKQTSVGGISLGPPLKSRWDLGLFYYSERIYYPEDTISYKKSYSFELTGRYHFTEFFIQSGFGLAFSEDDGRAKIDYQKYELSGIYEDVYDITFDSTEFGMMPVYHTKTVEVYDTLDQYTYSPMNHRYVYLQIPILFGYESQFYNRVFYNIKLGPVLAIMIKDHVSDVDYPTGDVRIMHIDDQMPTRINTSWQFILGAGLGYNISNHMSLAIEPTFKYYLGSGYKTPAMSTKHPYSIGIKGGLIYRF